MLIYQDILGDWIKDEEKVHLFTFYNMSLFFFLLLHLPVGCAPSEMENWHSLSRQTKCFRKAFSISFLQCPPEDVLSGCRSSWCNSDSSLKVPRHAYSCVHGTLTYLLLDFLSPQLPAKTSRFLFERDLHAVREEDSNQAQHNKHSTCKSLWF